MAESRSRASRAVKTTNRSHPENRSLVLRGNTSDSNDSYPVKWGDLKRDHSYRTLDREREDPPGEESSLLQMMTDLDIAIENKSDSVLKIVESVLAQIKEKGIESLSEVSALPSVQLVLLLRWKNNKVVANVAHIFAEVGKSPEGRERLACLQPPIAQQLVNLLQQKSQEMMAEAEGNVGMSGSMAVVSQVCRALGNMCYEYDRGQKCVLDAGGLPVLITVLERAVELAESHHKKKTDRGASLLTLRTVASGFLLNMICRSDKASCVTPLIPILTRLLELDGTSKEGEELVEHTLVILSVLLDSAGDYSMDERLCKILVRILSNTTSIDVSGTILELLHRHADSDKAKLQLARAGLSKLLVHLLDGQSLSNADEDGEQMTKMACDLIVFILNGDESMPLLYGKGQGELYRSMKRWLDSTDENRVVTAVLAMGNFARSDTHCLQMVEDQIGESLLKLLERHNQPNNTEVRLQHALLCAIRNLAIPEPNKAYFINQEAFRVLLPLMPSPALPVMFKLLGTIRTLIDGQGEAAKELGTNITFLNRIVECCSNEFHSGVKGEANRLIAWLVKHSKSEEVCRTLIDCRAVPHLVDMLKTEHAVMRNEALLALTTICATHMARVEPLLVDTKIAPKLAIVLSEHGATLQKPVICNILTFMGELVTSEVICKKLACAGVNGSLKKLMRERSDLADLETLVTKLSTVLESS